MSHLVQQAFGRADINLYEDVLKVKKDCNLSELRKAYYKQALQFHPDKNESESAKLKFQAISWTYSLLKNAAKRADYDQHGSFPSEDDDDAAEEGGGQWKDYFDTIFGKVSTSKINEFALKYKMSKEEESDVLSNYEKFRGDLRKMLEYIMLSDENDLSRWMEDYISPAIEKGLVKDHSKTSREILRRVQATMKKEKNTKDVTNDSDRTETEGSDEDCERTRAPVAKKKPLPTKAKPTKAKRSAGDDDLVAAIRNRRGRGNPIAALGARYGISMDDGDPLDDETFANLQSQYERKK